MSRLLSRGKRWRRNRKWDDCKESTFFFIQWNLFVAYDLESKIFYELLCINNIQLFIRKGTTYFIEKNEYFEYLMKAPTITNVICSHSHSVCTSYWRAIYGLVIQIRFFTTNLQIYILNRLVSRGKNKDSSIRKPCHNLIICSTYKCVLRWPSTHLWTGRW